MCILYILYMISLGDFSSLFPGVFLSHMRSCFFWKTSWRSCSCSR